MNSLSVRCALLGLLLIWTLALGGAAPVARPPVTPTYGVGGLQALQVNGIEQLADGAVRVVRVRTADAYRNSREMADPYVIDDRTFADASVEVRETRFDPQARCLTQTFDWGTVAVGYSAGPGQLDLQVAVQNTSPKVIEQIVMELLTLRVAPRGPSADQFRREPWNRDNNVGAPLLNVIQPNVTYFQRAAFPDDQGEKEIRTLCLACYPKEADEYLMETKLKAMPLDQVTEGVCARCGAETRLTREPLVVAGTLQADRPVAMQFTINGSTQIAGRDIWRITAPGTATLKITAGTAPAAEMYDGVWNVRPIKPGATEHFQIGLRFGPADQPAAVVGAEFVAAFRTAYPLQLRWPDRRPISMAHLCAETDWGKGNPRGWWGLRDTGADIDTPKGRELFDKWILGYADQLISVADKAGSQGVIVWDLEGKQYPGCVYYGDPRIMKYTAPEMERMADAFFTKLRNAGLRVGMCIRPTQIYPKAVRDDEMEKYRPHKFFAEMPYHETWETFNIKSFGQEFWAYGELGLKANTPLTDIKRSPVERLDAKIRYCKERWGATLFYIDTNHFNRSREKRGPNAAGGYDVTQNWGAAIMSAEQWAELQRRHPDCLLIPEHEYEQYWAATAPYREPPHDGASPGLVRAIWPEAFSCISMGGNAQPHIEKAAAAYATAVEGGDLLMTQGWYGPPKVLTDIYAHAAASAPITVTLAADGALTLQGRPVPDVKALQQQVAALVKGKAFAQRRAFIQYDPAAARAARTAAIAALTQADAVIAWAQARAATAQQPNTR
jgi:hypothetical protein